ncbi:MAG: diacylglycerol kinase family lipid kinase [Candidatus Dormibacteraeota bacterium]|nr:diacylglycerol kinase family lipid kinase [Candidatus Dormibacteraeota bacterium]
MTLPTLIVVNPASAGGRTGRDWPRLRRILSDTGVRGDEHLTSGCGDAIAAVRSALGSGCDRIVVVGGDGTLNEVVNGCFSEDGIPLGSLPAIGLLPAGTGGDFRRTLGVPAQPEAAAWIIAAGTTIPVDTGVVTYGDGSRRYFVNIADCGLGGEVVARVNRSSRKRGGPAGMGVFLWHSLAGLATYRGAGCTVTVDGDRLQLDAQSVVVANGQYFGGGMRVAPQAALDDGLFDVVIVERQGRGATVAGLPSLYRGRHTQRHGVRCLRGSSVAIAADPAMLFDIEGEQVGATPATVTCLPRALRFCVPRPLPGPPATDA